MSVDQPDKENAVREPSLVDALIRLLFMIALLATSIVLFGIDAALGPLQVALLMSAVVAAVVAHKNGHPWEKLGKEIVKGISGAMSFGAMMDYGGFDNKLITPIISRVKSAGGMIAAVMLTSIGLNIIAGDR